MIRLIFFWFLVFSLSSFASITQTSKKINANKQVLKEKTIKKQRATIRIKLLAREIKRQTKEFNKLEWEINKLNNHIQGQQKILHHKKQNLSDLFVDANTLKTNIKDIENNIVDLFVNDFAISLASNIANINTQTDIVNKELYTILSTYSKNKIRKLDIRYLQVSTHQFDNKNQIRKLKTYINKITSKKDKLLLLKKRQLKITKSLKQKRILYKQELNKIVQKQNALVGLLAKLNILQQKEIQKEIRKEKQLLSLKQQKVKKKYKTQTTRRKIANNINLNIKQVGSSTKGVKITKYTGTKTIAPLKSYIIKKRFGKHYDPVYKIKLFNESIELQTKIKNAKVYNILPGRVVYAKTNSGILDNVVIVKHNGGLHTIYSHLDRISSTLRVGKYLSKGYVVGRVSGTLIFQVAKNSKHINPLELFK